MDMEEMELLEIINKNNQNLIKNFIENKINNYVKKAVYLPIKIGFKNGMKNKEIINLIESDLFKNNILNRISTQIYKIKHNKIPKTIKNLILNMTNEEILLIVSNKINVFVKYYSNKVKDGEITKESCSKYEYVKKGRDNQIEITKALQTIKGHKTKIDITKAMLKVISSNIVRINKDGSSRKILTGLNIAKYFTEIKIDMINKNVCHYNKFIKDTNFDENTSDKEKVLVYRKFLKQEILRLESLVKQTRKIFKIIPKTSKVVDPLEIRFIPSENQLGKKRKSYRKTFKSLRETITHLRVA